MGRRITGRHVFLGFLAGFGVVVAANLVLAVSAVRTFPGLETRNSYVASRNFDADRAAQERLGWDVSARLDGDELRLEILEGGRPVAPVIEEAVFGRATHVADDQRPEFRYAGGAFVATVDGGPGNWNLRLRARARDGTPFRQRVVVATGR